ncbi:folylpolyglutamate synthase, mitochondrial-like isoform X2 [Physella acuta]|uniref:folylpolyglutamate synthase, mitochondrial-like isoform X2 n=1 Tax=Physella acuta TaxID=109671 RepID=UPI0027DD9F18|nr:folylpolyglutamate synthase, mitochondrial-like isoform X2 [Physella acuta]
MIKISRNLVRTMTSQLFTNTPQQSRSTNLKLDRSSSSFSSLAGGYEEAVIALQNLQSNAETIAKVRESKDKKNVKSVPNMNRYIHRSGLTVEEVDNLSVIHVSGTKGKGSTCAFCERILHSKGYKTGLFTSPHLIEVRERIRINGRPLSKEMFSKYFWKVYTALKQTETGDKEEGGGMPAYFAFFTVLSLHVFIAEGVDVAIMEVGIGGQYDSTNFFRKPVVCGVASLGLDHTSVLGNTIEQIAWNKAGIFKAGHPAITVPQVSNALQVLLDRAKEIKNPLYLAEPIRSEVVDKYNLHLGIDGAKQIENAALAVQLCRMWEKRNGQKELLPGTPDHQTLENIPVLEVQELDDATICGLSSCSWPGRTQIVTRDNVTYYLDGAHTKESIEVCSAWFKEASYKEKVQLSQNVIRILIFNSTGDRDVEPFLSCLKDCDFDAAVFCTNILSTDESMNIADQFNKTVTCQSMLKRAECNRESWDKLFNDEPDGSVTSTPTDKLDINYNEKDSLVFGPKKSVINSHFDETNDLSVPTDIIATKNVKRVSSHEGVKKKVPSFVFPCIYDALVWAAHGRDAAFVGQCVESPVATAGHVQVLITGSLHLVGGVLGVITPHMND